MMILRLIGAFIAIATSAILFEIPKRYLKYAGIVGTVGWFVYLISQETGANEFLATFLSATTIAIVSHVFARIFKVPVTVFLVAGILPTVPGTGMYRIAYSVLERNMNMTEYYLWTTLKLAGAIALAIFIVDAFFRMFQRNWKQNSLQYNDKMNENNIENSKKLEKCRKIQNNE